MAQMIQRGKELIRINTQKNSIEFSINGGSSWRSRFTGNFPGVFVDLMNYGSEILACTSRGIYCSKDGGNTWHYRYIGSSCGSFLQLFLDGQNI